MGEWGPTKPGTGSDEAGNKVERGGIESDGAGNVV